MATTRVQGARGTGTSSIAVTLGSTPSNGNALIACVCMCGSGGASVSSISQTNVTWTKQTSKAYSTSSSTSEIWFGVVSASASTSITFNLSNVNTGYYQIADVYEYSGVAVSSFLDKTASSAALSSSPNTGTTAATTQNDELWIGATAVTSGGYGANVAQSSPTNSFTLLDGANTDKSITAHSSLGFLEKIVSSTGTANTDTTIPSSQQWAGCIATFKASSTSTYKPETRTNLASTVTTMLNSKMFFSVCNRFPKLIVNNLI